MNKALLTAAVAGIVAASVAAHAADAPAVAKTDDKVAAEKNSCKDKNTCKGKDKHSYKAKADAPAAEKNSCKGKDAK